MSSAVQPMLEQLSDSTFHMLRCIVCLVHADKIIKDKERVFVKSLIRYLRREYLITPSQIQQLRDDFRAPKPVDEMLPRVTAARDREQLVVFAGLLAMADGEVHPDEKAVINKFVAHSQSQTALVPGPPQTAQPAAYPVDYQALMNEVREITRQEAYRQRLATSGVAPGSSPISVVDAALENAPVAAGADRAFAVMQEQPKLSRTFQSGLVPGEKIFGKAKYHRIYIIDGALRAFALWALLPYALKGWLHVQQWLAAAYQSGDYSGAVEKIVFALLSPKAHFVIVGLFWLAGMALIVYRLLVMMTTEIVITDLRLLILKGVFRAQKTTADISSLDAATVEYSLLGRWLNYGQITVMTKNKMDSRNLALVLPPVIEDPSAFITLIDRSRRLLRKHGHVVWAP